MTGSNDEIRVGMSVSSGWVNTDAHISELLARFWVEEVNEAGGLLVGQVRLPVRLIVYDDESEPLAAATAYERLVADDRVHVCVGPAAGHLIAEAYKVTEKHRCLLINSMAPDDALVRDHFRSTFMVGRPLTAAMGNIPPYLSRIGCRRLAHVYADIAGFPTLNRPLAGMVEAEPDVELVWQEVVEEGYAHWDELLRQMASASADALVYSIPAPDEVDLTKALRRSGVSFRCVFGSYAHFTVDRGGRLGSLGPHDFAGIHGWAYDERPEVATVGSDRTTLIDQFERRVGVPCPTILATYTGLAVWSELVRRAGTTDAAAVMQAAVAAKGDIVTATGRFDVDERGLPPARPGAIVQLQVTAQGEVVARVVHPPDDAQAEPDLLPYPRR